MNGSPARQRGLLCFLLLTSWGCERSAEPAAERACELREQESRGVVVDSVIPGSAAELAGLEVGDLLLSWQMAGATPADVDRGSFGDPFDYFEFQEEAAPRGEVQLLALRGERRLELTVDHHALGLRVRPQLPDERLEAYRGAVEQLGQKADALQSLAEAAVADDDRRLAIWYLLRGGRGLEALGRHDEALAQLREASRLAKEWNELEAVTWVEMEIANGLYSNGRADEAIVHYEHALELRQRLYGEALCVASTLNNMGVAKQQLGDLAPSEALHREALALRERLSPGSLEVTQSLSNLAKLAAQRGDLAAAERDFLRILEIRRARAPGSVDLAHAYNSVGVISGMQGDRAAAEEAMLQSLELWRALAPQSGNHSKVLQNLGVLAKDRGDLAAAERHYREAMAVEEQKSSDSLDTAWHLQNLAGLAHQRGDLEAARRDYHRALKIRQQRAPGSRDHALALIGLSDVACDRGDLEGAEQLLGQVLEIQSQSAAEGLDVARTLLKRGQIKRRQGHLDEAEQDLARSAEIFAQKASSDGFFTAANLQLVGSVAFDRGDLKTAQRAFTEALGIFRQLAPGSRREALVLHRLGRVFRASGRPEQAREQFELAIEALESQASMLGGTDETQSIFRANHLEIYQDLIELLVEQGEAREAFHVLERSRARALLDLLAKRDLVFDLDLPADLERRRRRLGVRYDRAQERLVELSPRDDAVQLHAGRRELEDLRRQRQILRDEILRSAPNLAALQDPKPLDAAEAQQALDPGTVLLAFDVGESTSHLFVVTSEHLLVSTLPFGDEDLRRRVDRLRLLLEQPETELAPLRNLASALYRDLLGSATDLVDRSERILVVPDGPLHKLPFGALAKPDGHYLIEAKPLHVVASITVYDELRKRRAHSAATDPPTLIAFGDPIYPATGASVEPSQTVRGTSGQSSGFPRLIASRHEVSQIGRLYGDAARIFLGSEATEERVKNVGRGTRVLHLAAHVVIDELFPLNSGVALSTSARGDGESNGLLQAWEIFEGIRLDADLVTLSACESALGKEVAGEGLMGLTRAFQYAGARSVVASLWRVGDRSTAALMTHFYSHLRSGMSHDEALRQAQLDLVRGPVAVPSESAGHRFWNRILPFRKSPADTLDASHPYHWAAFQVFGDWRSGE